MNGRTKRIAGRAIRSLLVAAVVAGGIAAVPAASAQAATPSGHTAAGKGFSRPLCPLPKPGEAQCMAEIATDSSGRPLHASSPLAAGKFAPAAGTVTALSPNNIHSAYALPWSSSYRQTIALVDAYDHPYVKGRLDAFDSAWNLGSFPTCSGTVTTSCFQRVDQNGNNSGFVNNDPVMAAKWDGETDMDVQWAHAICLNCKILLVEAYSQSTTDLAAAVNTAARLGATQISNSYGWLEGSITQWNPSAYNHAGIAITASSGDYGFGPYYPADLNSVVAVGGTSLYLNSTGGYGSETVWGNGVNAPNGSGAGSGCSTFQDPYTAATTWQTSVSNWKYTGCGTQRSISDISAVADPNTGVWVYTSGLSGVAWYKFGGTSLSAPIIAAAFALAANTGGYNWPAQYMYQHTNQFHDVTSGANGSCSYTIECQGWSGYDGPTGLGTPWGIGGF
jgi:subtilase family serine protease